MTFVDYGQIVEDLVTLIRNSGIEFDLVEEHMSDYERNISNTSYCNVTLSRNDIEVESMNSYLSRVALKVEVAALDLSSKREAVKIRNDLVNELQLLIKNNRQFSAEIETAILTDVDFEVFGNFSDEDEEQSFTATAVLTVVVVRDSQ
jgi:hypothetical protein